MAKNRVLLLNNDYSPISTLGIHQTMRKLCKADSVLHVVEWTDTVIKTQKGEYPVPSVIRLTYYLDIRKRRAKSGAKRLRIYQRDKYRCSFCGKKITDVSKLTLDHIVPKSRGGSSTPDNLVTACKPCNNRKGDRTPQEAKMPLLVPESVLKIHLETISLRDTSEYQENWKKFLFLDTDHEYNQHESVA